MAKSLERLLKQQASLNEEVAQLQRRENTSKVLEDIRKFGLTQQDLFGGHARTARAASPATKFKLKAGEIFRGKEEGEIWAGKGPRPKWLRALLEAGVNLESLVAKAKAPRAARQAPTAPASKKRVAKATAERKPAKAAPKPAALGKISKTRGKQKAAPPAVKKRASSAATGKSSAKVAIKSPGKSGLKGASKHSGKMPVAKRPASRAAAPKVVSKRPASKTSAKAKPVVKEERGLPAAAPQSTDAAV